MWFAVAITGAIALITIIGLIYYCCKKEEKVIRLNPVQPYPQLTPGMDQTTAKMVGQPSPRVAPTNTQVFAQFGVPPPPKQDRLVPRDYSSLMLND